MGNLFIAAYIGKSNTYTNELQLGIIYESTTPSRAINMMLHYVFYCNLSGFYLLLRLIDFFGGHNSSLYKALKLLSTF